MNIIDFILLGISIGFFIWGMFSGFVRQLMAILTLTVGIWFAYYAGSHWFEGTNRVLAFIVIFILIAILSYWIGKITQKIISIIMLKWLDKLLGGFFMLARTLLILSVLFQLIFYINKTFVILPQTYIDDSLLIKPIANIVIWLYFSIDFSHFFA